MNQSRKYKKSIGLIILCISIVTLLAISPIPNVQAVDDEYTLLEPLPCIMANGVACPEGNQVEIVEKVTFEDYIKYAINTIIALAAVAAVFMIVWGGLQYMTTTIVSGKSEGLKKVQNAIYGLLLVLCSYLILRTIDPRLVKVPTTLVPKIKLSGELTKDSVGEFFRTLENQASGLTVDTRQLLQDIQNGKAAVAQAQQQRQALCEQLAITTATSGYDPSLMVIPEYNPSQHYDSSLDPESINDPLISRGIYKDQCAALIANSHLLGQNSQSIAAQIVGLDNQINKTQADLIIEKHQYSTLDRVNNVLVATTNQTGNTSARLSNEMDVIEAQYRSDLSKLQQYGTPSSEQIKNMEDYKNYALGMLQIQKDIVDGPSTWSKAVSIIPATFSTIVKGGSMGIIAGPTAGGVVASKAFTRSYIDAHQQALANKINSDAIIRYGDAIENPALKNRFMETANEIVDSIRPSN